MKKRIASILIISLTLISINLRAETTPNLDKIAEQIAQIEAVNDEILASFHLKAEKINGELASNEYEIDAYELWLIDKNSK